MSDVEEIDFIDMMEVRKMLHISYQTLKRLEAEDPDFPASYNISSKKRLWDKNEVKEFLLNSKYKVGRRLKRKFVWRDTGIADLLNKVGNKIYQKRKKDLEKIRKERAAAAEQTNNVVEENSTEVTEIVDTPKI